MQNATAVFATDAVNRYFIRFSVGAMAGMVWDNCQAGLPMCLSHDVTRPLGWSAPRALILEPGMARVVGTSSIAVDDGDNQVLLSKINQHLYHRLVDERQEGLEELRRRLGDRIQGEAEPTCLECVTVCEPGLAMRTFPHVFGARVKDDLVPLDHLQPVGPGIFRDGDLLLFAHPYFRRSFSRLNALNGDFLRRFQSHPRDTTAAKIALDPDLVGLASTYADQHFEFEYWWGPKFSDDLTTIAPGVTVHRADADELLFHPISSTEFWWHSRDGIHTLEAEELRDEPSIRQPEPHYGCRYVHSMVREGDGVIEHFDGAVRLYPEEAMVERLDKDIMHAGRHSEYTKLWRLDGVIAVPEWKALLSDYFRDNRMVGEYLGAPAEDAVGAPVDVATTTLPNPSGPGAVTFDLGEPADGEAAVNPTRPQVEGVRQRLVPYSIAPGDGIRVGLSYWPLPPQPSCSGAFVLAEHSLADGDRRTFVADGDVLELRKALARSGGTLHIPDGIGLLNFDDLYVGLPTVHHTKDDLPRQLSMTHQALHALVAAWDASSCGRVIGFSLGIPLEDREAVVSVVGHTRDMMAFLALPLWRRVPMDRDGWSEWMEEVASHVNMASGGGASWSELLSDSWLVSVERKPVQDVEYRLVPSARGLDYQLAIPKEQKALYDAIRCGEVTVAAAHLVTASVCSRCSRDYFECGCSRVLDSDVVQRIEAGEVAFPFWTDRSAWRDAEALTR